MVLVAKFIVMTGRHGLKRSYLPRFGVGFLCNFVSVIGVLQSPLQIPVSQFVFPFFIMFGGRPMSVRSKFVLIGRLPVCRTRCPPMTDLTSPRIIVLPRQRCGLLARYPMHGSGSPEIARSGDRRDGWRKAHHCHPSQAGLLNKTIPVFPG